MRAEQNFKWEKLSLGTCYYPEHWDKKMWRDDLRRMKENGIFTIRIAEFAWNKVEPAEGEFTYEFFDEFLDVAEEEQMKNIVRRRIIAKRNIARGEKLSLVQVGEFGLICGGVVVGRKSFACNLINFVCYACKLGFDSV